MTGQAAATTLAVVAVCLLVGAALVVVGQRRRATRLDASEHRHRSILEASGQVLYETDLQGNVIYAGHGFAEMVGIGVGEPILLPSIANIHPEDRPAVADGFRKLIAGELPVVSGSMRLRHPVTGEERVVQALTTVRRRGNRICGVVGTMFDTTDASRERAAAQVAEWREQEVLDALPDAVIVLDAHGDLERANPRAQELIDADRSGSGSAGGMQLRIDAAGNAIAPADLPGPRALRTGQPVEDVLVGAEGPQGTRWRRVSARPLQLGPDNRPRGAVVVFRDVSEEFHAVTELEGARREAERANEAKTEFMRRLHHELRTPLNAVSTAAQLLDERDLPEAERRIAARIIKGCRLALGLMEELREISLIEDGQLRFRHDATDVAEAISQAVSLVEHLRGPAGITLVVDPPDPGLRTWADSKRLSQVLVNLLSNAIKYNRPHGQVRVQAEVGDDRVRIAVSDTGMGVATDDLERMFEPFERLGAARTGVEGTGLGLSISRRLVETMGGTLRAESSPGSGTTFTVDLARAPSAEPAPPSTSEGSPGDDDELSATTVLYVEDNPDNIELMHEVFARWPQLHLATAMTGEEGVRATTDLMPTLVLLDLHLPDAHGLQVLRRLRDEPSTASIPVIMVTADATGWEHEVPAAERPDAIVTKPLDVRSFCALVEQWVRPAASPAAARG